MSIVDHQGEVEYPFCTQTVFKAILDSASSINGLSIDSADELSGRVTFKAGVSLASWGENISVQLIQLSPARTQMKVLSTPKTGIMFGGAADFGKNRQNINKIIAAVSKTLASKTPETDPGSINNQVSIADELTKLKTLYDQGILSQEEFEAQKKKCLDQSVSAVATTNSTPAETSYSANKPIHIESKGGNASSNTLAIIAAIVLAIIIALTIAL